MESLPNDCVIKFNPDTLEAVRKDVGLENPVRINEAINILEDWIKKQSHFNKKDFPRSYLEITLIISKGLVERAKQRIEKLCTYRTLMPELFVKVPVEEFSELSKIIYHAHMPKLTKEHYRVYIFKIFSTNLDSRTLMKYYRNGIMFGEYLRKYEYSSGFQVILDFRDCNVMQFISKFNPLDFRQFLMVLMEGYGMRIKGIYVITTSKMVDGLISLIKQVVSAKLVDRIIAYKTVEPLSEFIPIDVLPVELGGTENSLKDLNGWHKSVVVLFFKKGDNTLLKNDRPISLLSHVPSCFQQLLKAIGTPEFQEYFEDTLKANTDESRRQSNSFNAEYAGTPGSFRALVVD